MYFVILTTAWWIYWDFVAFFWKTTFFLPKRHLEQSRSKTEIPKYRYNLSLHRNVQFLSVFQMKIAWMNLLLVQEEFSFLLRLFKFAYFFLKCRNLIVFSNFFNSLFFLLVFIFLVIFDSCCSNWFDLFHWLYTFKILLTYQNRWAKQPGYNSDDINYIVYF